MTDSLSRIRTRNTRTPQNDRVLGRDDQAANNAGGFVFGVADEDRVMRFLTLGTDGGTYYQKEQEHTLENAKFMIGFATDHGSRLVRLLADVSVAGRAPRQNPALFALALVFAFGDDEAVALARSEFLAVVRTAVHLFTFVKYAGQFRGWGPALTKAVASWYLSPSARDLSYQLVKYRQREGYTHRDILRLAHPKTSDAEKNALFAWAVGKGGEQVGWVKPYEQAKQHARTSQVAGAPVRKGVYADLIRDNPGMSWEMLPDEALTKAEVWEALISNGLPLGALIRQMPRITNLGLLHGSVLNEIVTQLTSPGHLRAARIHPVKLLYALKTYAQGHSTGPGKSTWMPDQRIVDAYDAAFYASFGALTPTGKRTMLTLDLSDSMTWDSNRCGVITAREGAAAMALATAAVESDYLITGFSAGPDAAVYNTGSYYKTGIGPLAVSPRRRLDDNVRTIDSSYAGGTDCSLPMVFAMDNNLLVDVFVVYTDNETHGGLMHPFEALRRYRRESGIDAKMIVVGMSSTGFTIADPKDRGMLDVAGFDADTPAVISGFARGDFS